MTAAVPKGKGGVDRSTLPRYPDGSQWLPPGLPRDASDADLAAALRGAWGTPAWVLDLAEWVRALCGGPPNGTGFDLDAGTRPGTASWARSQWHIDGSSARGDALSPSLSWFFTGRAWHWQRFVGQDVGVGAFHAIRPSVWCNFPFSDPAPWVAKALEAAREGCWVSVLAPHTTGAWWDDLRAAMVAEVPLRRVEFEACPGLLGPDGKPARGDRPSQQCSLVTLAPAGATLPAIPPRMLRAVAGRLGEQSFVLLPGPAAAARDDA